MAKNDAKSRPASNGAATVKALGDAVTGGNGTVEVAHALTFQRPVEVHLSVEEVVSYLLRMGWKERNSGAQIRRFENTRGGAEFLARIPAGNNPEPTTLSHKAIAEIARHEERHPFDVVASIIQTRGGAVAERVRASTTASVAVRHALLTVRDGIASMSRNYSTAVRFIQRKIDETCSADQRPAIDAAICRLVTVSSAKGVREDEVLRFLEALELDEDIGEKRLAKLVEAEVLTWREQKGKPDAPLVYRRGPAFARGAAR